MDNTNTAAPVIPAGTNTQGGMAYNPLKAAIQASQGQAAAQVPVSPAPATQVAPVVETNVSTNAPQGTTFAELAAKKGFQSPDDLAKAYANLETHNKKVEMTAADIIKEVYQTASAPVASTPVAVNPQGNQEAVKIVENIVKSTVKPLEEQVALQNLFLKNPDAPQYAAQMAKIVKESPSTPWEVAYKAAKFDDLNQKAQTVQQQGQQQTQVLKNQVMAGAAQPTVSRGGPDVRSIIKDRSVPFKEVDRIVREALNSMQ